jgi:hypothetical protein
MTSTSTQPLIHGEKETKYFTVHATCQQHRHGTEIEQLRESRSGIEQLRSKTEESRTAERLHGCTRCAMKPPSDERASLLMASGSPTSGSGPCFASRRAPRDCEGEDEDWS